MEQVMNANDVRPALAVTFTLLAYLAGKDESAEFPRWLDETVTLLAPELTKATSRQLLHKVDELKAMPCT